MNLFSEKTYIDYQKNYFLDSKFKIIEVNLTEKNKNSKLFFTIENRGNMKTLNNFNNPIYIDDLGLDLKSYSNLIKEIKKVCLNEGISSISFKKKIKQSNLEDQLNKNKSHIDFIGIESSINLNDDLNVIFRKFSKGHKSSLKKNYENLNYELFDHKNYQKNQIFEMMTFHEKIAGRQTRSKETWKINEKMILDNKGLLIKVLENKKLISYTFIFFNKENSIYFSSCTDRNMFKIYKNISHKVIWQAIQYLKLVNCKKFYLGVTKSIYSKSLISNKEKSIDLFKSSFGGDKNHFIIINNLESIQI